LVNHDDPYFDKGKGSWFCRNVGDAISIFSDDPTAKVFLYDRAEDGCMVNIREYKNENDKLPWRHLKHGRLIKE
jgi:hypothetical protein